MATLNPSQRSVSAGSGWRGKPELDAVPEHLSVLRGLWHRSSSGFRAVFLPLIPLSCHLIRILVGKPWQPSRGLALRCGFFPPSFSVCRILVPWSALINLHWLQNFDYLWVFRVSTTLWEKTVNFGLCSCSLPLIHSVTGLLIFLYFSLLNKLLSSPSPPQGIGDLKEWKSRNE